MWLLRTAVRVPTTTTTTTTTTSGGNRAVTGWEMVRLSHLILFSVEPTPAGGITALDRIPRKELLEEAKAEAKNRGTALLSG